jgi:hypothetical protein
MMPENAAIDFDSEIYTVLEKIQDKSLNFKSVKKYLVQLASNWPKEKLIELLIIILYQIKMMNRYTNKKLNSEGYTNRIAFGSIFCPLPSATD